MKVHMTDDVDWRPADGWYTARCSCGWSDGPFPDVETMVDALMDHAAAAAMADRPSAGGGPGR